jgi:Ca2+-binding RTX toxin-like protein
MAIINTGTDQNDTITGTDGNDTLNGGLGQDLLIGGLGQDTYLFGVGNGHDTLDSRVSLPSGSAPSSNDDTLVLGSGLALKDFLYVTDSEGFHLRRIEGGSFSPGVFSSIDWLRDGTATDTILFNDGTSITLAPSGQRILGGQGADTLGLVNAGATIVQGGAGNDEVHLNSYYGADAANAVADVLLDAGFGQDTLYLRETPLARFGSGAPTPSQETAVSAYRIVLGSGISAGDVELRQLDDVLLPNGSRGLSGGMQTTWQLRVKSTGDVLTVVDLDPFASPFSPLRAHDELKSLTSIVFADGQTWSPQQVLALLRDPSSVATTLYGTSGDDVLTDNAMSHVLFGGVGNDTLTSGAGNDQLIGDAGLDTYVYARGDGADTIFADSQDTIQLGAGIAKGDILIGKLDTASNTVVLQVKAATGASTDSITLAGSAWTNGLQLTFADGSSLTGADILTVATRVDNLTLTGTTKADALTGKDGNDTLSGLAGNDTLAGGKGNDSLRGGFGADTYVFNRGDGRDTLSVDEATSDSAQYQANRDVLALGAGIRFDDFKLSRIDKGYRLDITDGDVLTGDSIDLEIGNGTGVNHTIQFADGNSLGFTELDDILSYGVQPRRTITGTAGDDTLRAFKYGADIQAGDGNDRIISGPGNDVVSGGKGADVFVFGSGSGKDFYGSLEDAAQDIIELTGTLGLNDFIVSARPLVWSTELSLALKDGTAALRISDVNNDGSGRITPISNLPSVKLADGTIISAADLYARRQQSTDGDDTLYADPFASVSGGKGNDLLISGTLDAEVTRGEVLGGEGNDTLVAGEGYVLLDGGAGADTFVLKRIGAPVGVNQRITADSADTIEYAPGIQRGDVRASYYFSGESVEMQLNLEGNDRANAYVTNIANATGLSVKFADGTTIKAIDLAPVEGLSFYGQSGNETLKGFLGNDTLEGSTGNDLLDGGAGADTYTYDSGDGKDTIVADTTDILEFRTATARTLTIGKLGATVANAVVLGSSADRLGGTVTLTNAGQWAGLQVKLSDGTVVTGAQILASATMSDNLTLMGTSEADKLTGKDGNDTLSGLAGNDTLAGGEGLDVLIGGTGSDVLDGGAGADTYQYVVGDGADLIRADGLDTIALGAGLSKANVQIGKLGAKLGNAVVLGMGSNASDTITLDNAGSWAGLQLKFADGSTLSGSDIFAAAIKPDNLTLNGTTKADALTGKDGNDTLNGLAGNDTLAGGKGNDSLIGGKGNDTYLFNRGDGQDVVNDTDSALFNSDLLKLGGATSKQLWLTKSGKDLSIQILGTQDKVMVQNWYAGSANQVEKITASDGKSLSASKVNALVNAMASFTPPADAASLPANTPTAVTKLVASSWV